MSEVRVTISATYDEMDFLFHESCYSHPQVPLFDLGIKSYEEIREGGDESIHIDRNKRRTFSVVVRNSKAKNGTHYAPALSFIKHLRTAEKGYVYTIEPHVRERFGYTNDHFINGADLTDDEILDVMKRYKADLNELKYAPCDIGDIHIRKAYNNGIDKSFETDLDADGRHAFAEGYYQGAAEILNDVADFIKLLKKKTEADKQTQWLKDTLPNSLDQLRGHYEKLNNLQCDIDKFIKMYQGRGE